MVRRHGCAAWIIQLQGELASGVTPQKDDSCLGLEYAELAQRCHSAEAVATYNKSNDFHLATWSHPNAEHQYMVDIMMYTTSRAYDT